ncbi:MAG: hypothetical protein RMA76_15620 [Deltaproteobacteria bacterium]
MKIDNERNSLRRTVGIGAPMPARPRARAAVAPRPLQEVRLTELGHSFQENMAPLATKVLDASSLVRFQTNVGGLASPPPPSGTPGNGLPPPPASQADAFANLQELAADAEPLPDLDIDQADVDAVNDQLEIARAATEAGDYATALAAYEALGLPVEDTANLTDEELATLVLLGLAEVDVDNGTYEFDDYDATYQELQGLALNAQLMVAMANAGVTPSENPPTQAEAQLYMESLVAAGASTEELFAAASAFVEGTVVLYNHAGMTGEPAYGADTPRYVLMDGDQRHEFADEADALAMAKELDVHYVKSESTLPDSWDDAYSLDTSGARHIGDCENTLYLMNQLLSYAGFEDVGSAMISGGDDVIAHMVGIYRDGEDYYVTSNADFARVNSSTTNVTNASIEKAVKAAAVDVYGTSFGLTFTYAKQPSGAAGDPGVESMRRAQEYATLGYEEELL